MGVRLYTLLKRSALSININARSGKTGFAITFTKRPNEKRSFSTEHYKENNTALYYYPLEKLISFCLTLPLAILMARELNVTDPLQSLAAIAKVLLIISGGYLFYSFFLDAFFWLNNWSAMKNLKEWHACEHKTIGLILEKKEPTAPNLRRSPALSGTCGSVWDLAGWQVLFYIWLLLFLLFGPPYSVSAWPEFFVFGMLVSSYCLFTVLDLGGAKTKTGMALTLAAIAPALVLPLIYQRILYLKTPSAEKISGTLAAVQKFLEDNKNFLEPDS